MAHKYRAKPTEYNGVNYSSKAEAHRAQELDLMLAAGTIIEWVRQPVFRLGVPENKYVADFLVIREHTKDWPSGMEVWVEDVKGQELPAFKKNKRLWAKYGRLPLVILKAKGKRLVATERIEPEVTR